MSKKKKKRGARHWTGYTDEDRKQAAMELSGKLPEDNGFYGKHHFKRQKMF